MKKLITLICIAGLLASCSTQRSLHETGTYTIKSREGDLTEFYEVKGKYIVISDTLKKWDQITINVIHPAKHKN